MTEEQLTSEILIYVARRMHEEKKGVYEASRILGYVLVGMAEALPDHGDDASAPKATDS